MHIKRQKGPCTVLKTRSQRRQSSLPVAPSLDFLPCKDIFIVTTDAHMARKSSFWSRPVHEASRNESANHIQASDDLCSTAGPLTHVRP